MFERYTELARRAIFYARYEAAQLGSAFIETGHRVAGQLPRGRRRKAGVLHPSAQAQEGL